MRSENRSLGLLLLAVSALSTVISILPGSSRGQMTTRPVRRPFELSAGQSLDKDGNTLLVLSTAIDYRRLIFFRQPSGYVADYRIIIEIRDEEGHRVRGEVAEENVTVPKYEMTRSAGLLSKVTRKIPIDSGEYDVQVIIEVVKTSLKYERLAEVKILGKEQGLFEIADPVFSSPESGQQLGKPPVGELIFSDCSSQIERGFRPLAGEVFIGSEGWIRIGFTFLSPTDNRTGRDVDVTVKVHDLQNHIKAYTRKSLEVDSEGRGIFCVDMNVDDLPIGFYEVAAAVSIPNSTKKAVGSGKFTMLLGKAMFRMYFEDTLELLSYVAEDRELEDLRAAAPEQRIEEWNRYWKSEDPTRTTDLNEALSEFMRRVRFSLENFSKHEAGWKTDMGRIYIRNGPPDNEADRDGRTLGTRLKIWYYYSKGIAFIFEDSTGSGLYRLIDTRSI